MPFCYKCGNFEEEGRTYCRKCGEPMHVEKKDDAQKARDAFEQFTDTPDSTAQYTQADIDANKKFGILAYLGFLVLIPLFAAKDSPYARFHTNQGLVLFLTYSAWEVTSYVLHWTVWFASWTIDLADAAVAIAYIALVVIGIINAAKRRARELPLLGGIRILK